MRQGEIPPPLLYLSYLQTEEIEEAVSKLKGKLTRGKLTLKQRSVLRNVLADMEEELGRRERYGLRAMRSGTPYNAARGASMTENQRRRHE